MRKRKKLLTRILSLVLALTIMIPEQAAYARVPIVEEDEIEATHVHTGTWVVKKKATSCKTLGKREWRCAICDTYMGKTETF